MFHKGQVRVLYCTTCFGQRQGDRKLRIMLDCLFLIFNKFAEESCMCSAKKFGVVGLRASRSLS